MFLIRRECSQKTKKLEKYEKIEQGKTVKRSNLDRDRLNGTESAAGQPCLVCSSIGHQTIECPQLLSEARKKIEKDNRRNERANLAFERSRKGKKREDSESDSSGYEVGRMAVVEEEIEENDEEEFKIYKIECKNRPAMFGSDYLILIHAMTYEELCVWLTDTFEAQNIIVMKFPTKWNILFNINDSDSPERWEAALSTKLIDLNISTDLSEERNLDNNIEDAVFDDWKEGQNLYEDSSEDESDSINMIPPDIHLVKELTEAQKREFFEEQEDTLVGNSSDSSDDIKIPELAERESLLHHLPKPAASPDSSSDEETVSSKILHQTYQKQFMEKA